MSPAKIRVISIVALITGLLSTFSAYADTGALRARLAGQLAGNQTFTTDGSSVNYSASAGGSIAAEALFTVLPWMQAGVGGEYQFRRSISISGLAANFQYVVPLYGVFRFPITLGSITPYAVARIGYAIWSGDNNYTGGATLNSGPYFSLGGGLDYSLGPFAVFAEAAFSINNGSIPLSDGYTEVVDYTRLDVSIGVSIPF